MCARVRGVVNPNEILRDFGNLPPLLNARMPPRIGARNEPVGFSELEKAARRSRTSYRLKKGETTSARRRRPAAKKEIFPVIQTTARTPLVATKRRLHRIVLAQNQPQNKSENLFEKKRHFLQELCNIVGHVFKTLEICSMCLSKSDSGRVHAKNAEKKGERSNEPNRQYIHARGHASVLNI